MKVWLNIKWDGLLECMFLLQLLLTLKMKLFYTWSTQEGRDKGKSFGWKIGRLGTNWKTDV